MSMKPVLYFQSFLSVRCEAEDVSYDRSTLSGWKAKSQIGFFSFMVKPMYEVLDLIAPMTDQLKALDELVTYWKGQVAPPTEGGRI